MSWGLRLSHIPSRPSPGAFDFASDLRPLDKFAPFQQLLKLWQELASRCMGYDGGPPSLQASRCLDPECSSQGLVRLKPSSCLHGLYMKAFHEFPRVKSEERRDGRCKTRAACSQATVQ